MTDNYAAAKWRPSPNFSPGPRTIDMVIIHDTEGGYEGSIQWLALPTTQASAHYIVRSSDGEVSQMVHEANIAWHSGDSTYNKRSIGIEHEGFLAQPSQWYTEAMLIASAKLTADICRRYNIPVDRSHIIGHQEVRNSDGTLGGSNHHTDPGPGWPWERYMQMVRDFLTGAASIQLDPDYPVYANPTINLSIFRDALRNAASPAYDEVEDCYQVCTDNGVNPAVALAFFAQESNYGNAPGAVERKNWGNLTANGQLTTYEAWALGLRDWCNHFRTGVYANRGLSTISQIVPVYQPSSAGGSIVGYNTYTRGLYNLIKGWADQLSTITTFAPTDATTTSFAATVAAPTPAERGPAPDYAKALWQPSANYTADNRGNLDTIIIHTTEGSYAASLSLFTSPQSPNLQSSVHYLLRSSDGEVTQLVHEADTAWHAGNLEYNRRSIGISHEGFANAADKWYTEAMLTASANLVADICRRQNIPADRQHIIGHNEIRNSDGTLGGAAHHTDPGPGWPWDKYMQLVQAAATAKEVKEVITVQTVAAMTPDTTTDITAASFATTDSTPDSPLAAEFRANPNLEGRAGNAVSIVIIHDTEGGFQGSIDYLVQNGTSAHYIVRSSDGYIVQLVRESQAAYHAGNLAYNRRAIGIEHEGFANAPQQWYTEPLLTASAKLVADICTRYKISIDRSHIIAHAEVPDPDHPGKFGGQSNHTDPGPGWPWDRYIGLVKQFAGQGSPLPPQPQPPATVTPPDPDYALYAAPTISPQGFRQVLLQAGSPAYDEGADDLYQTCVAQGVNPAVALAFFKLESNYGNNDPQGLKNWGNLTDKASGQLKRYNSWKDSLAEWCNHFRLPPYSTDNLNTISQIVPVYQPSSAGGTAAGLSNYVNQLHDAIKGWSDAEAGGGNLSFSTAPDPTIGSFSTTTDPAIAANTTVAPAAKGGATGAATITSTEETDLQWVDGIGPAFAQLLNAQGIRTTQDLANATVVQLRTTGINRNDEEFASWIQQAKARIGKKEVDRPFDPAASAGIAAGGDVADPTVSSFGVTDTRPRLADPSANDYPLLGPPSISFAEFSKVFLRHPESPLWQEASPNGNRQAEDLRPYWDKIISYGVDPLIALAFFAHESTLGRDAAIAPRRNWGNLKRGGQYESFSTWLDGLDAWLRRVTGPIYLGAGLNTIAKIVPVYAPAFENPGYYDDLINNYIHPFLNQDPAPVYADAIPLSPAPDTGRGGQNIVRPDPDYAIYASPTINLTLFRETLQNAGSPAFDEVDALYDTCIQAGVNPAVALAFFALESNYGSDPTTAALKNWGNLIDKNSGQLQQYPTWQAGVADWGNHFRLPPYSTDNLATISQIVPRYQPSSTGRTIVGYNTYITRLHDLIKGWQDQMTSRFGVVFGA